MIAMSLSYSSARTPCQARNPRNIHRSSHSLVTLMVDWVINWDFKQKAKFIVMKQQDQEFSHHNYKNHQMKA